MKTLQERENEDEDEEFWEKREVAYLNRGIKETFKDQVQIKKSEPLKLLIAKKVWKTNRFTGAEFQSWQYLEGARRLLIPNTLITEYEFARWLLLEYGQGEYFVRTWHSYPVSPYIKKYSKRKSHKGLFVFWKGAVTAQWFQRYQGSLIGYLKPSLPVGTKHLF